MYFIRILIFIICLAITNSLCAQDIKYIDTLFLTKEKEKKSGTYLNIYFSSKDCYRCSGEIHKIVSYIENNAIDIPIHIISDNVLLAKKEMKSYDLPFIFFSDTDVFKEHLKSFFYLKKDHVFYVNLAQVLKQIKVDNKDVVVLKDVNSINYNKLKGIHIEDSRLSANNINYAGFFKQHVFLFDQVVERGAILNSNKGKLDYYETTQFSEKIYNLSFNDFEIKDFSLVNYEKASEFREENKNHEVKVTAITVYENRVYTQFLVSRYFEKEGMGDDLYVFTFPYLAIKELKQEDDIFDIFDLELYDSYVEVEYLNFSSKTYRFGVGVYFPILKILNKNRFITHLYEDSDYVGTATFELSEDLKTLSILEIEPKEEVIFSFPTFKLEQGEFFFEKKMTDELTGKGIISLKQVVL